jgi:uncharacterized protein YmfQ (DUF2313 family)
VVVPGAGHVVFEEMPEESNRLMLNWLRHGAVGQPNVVSRSASARQRRDRVAAKGRAGAGRRLAPEAQSGGD